MIIFRKGACLTCVLDLKCRSGVLHSVPTRTMPFPKPGDQLPDVELYEGTPLNDIKEGSQPIKPVKLRDVFAGKKGVLCSVTGAFTPSCSKAHLPSYVELYDQFKEAGAEVIVFTSVNDPYTLIEWGVINHAVPKIRFLADTHGKLAEALDVVQEDVAAKLGTKRGKRFSAVIKDNQFTHFNPDGDSPSVSLAAPTLKQVQEVK